MQFPEDKAGSIRLERDRTAIMALAQDFWFRYEILDEGERSCHELMDRAGGDPPAGRLEVAHTGRCKNMMSHIVEIEDIRNNTPKMTEAEFLAVEGNWLPHGYEPGLPPATYLHQTLFDGTAHSSAAGGIHINFT